jgi:acetyl-CoA C-acetyltransferase/acetyl-CoA acyltransferase
LPETRDVVVLEGARTPFCRAGTLLADLDAVELGRAAVREAIERAEVAPGEIDEVIVGNIAGPHDAANVGRVIALAAGVPRRVPASTVNRNCGSALQAIADAALKIRAGEAAVVVAAGVESMSRIPVLYPESFKRILARAARAKSAGARLAAFAALRPRDFKPVIALETGLTDPVSGLNMGETAEVLAREFGVTREEQDRFALESHQRAARAWAEGRLADEVAPLPLPPRYETLAEKDNGIRENQSLEALAKLKPWFDREYGTVTAGNSSQITDGAAAVVLASEERARASGLPILGRVRAVAFAACDPERMGLGPAYATPMALARAGLTLEQIDLVEINEAFAAQVIACVRAMESATFARDKLGLAAPVGSLDPARTNVNGGAIALGHPVGASGARLVLTLLKEMARRDVALGLATLCIGGGQGGAIVLERA